MRLNQKLTTALKPIITWWIGLLPREKRIVVGGTASLVVLLIYVIVDAAIGSINQQTIELASSQQKLREVEQDLVTYAQLVKRKEALENHFRTIEIQEGVRTLIERLLREKGEVKETPSIRDLPPSSLGGEYEVVQYSVNFSINSMKSLAAFLQELAHGSKPVLITQLDIKKNQRTADRVDVQLNVSSIRPKTV
jgi:hypothetical protein